MSGAWRLIGAPLFADFPFVAVQVKHIASSNYFISSPITGDAVPAAIKHGSGPADVKTKADMLKFLKESFAVGRKAAATLTADNTLQPFARKGPAPGPYGVRSGARPQSLQANGRVSPNGIVPPASREKSD